MNDIARGESPKKKRKRPRVPKEYPNHYWVRWLPQCQGTVTAWYEVQALEKPDGTHRTMHLEKGVQGTSHLLGQIGTSRLEFPTDKRLLKMPHPAEFLREKIITESNRAQNFIDYVLAQNGVLIDERWKWIWPKSCYFVMSDEPPFPAEGFRGGRYTGLKAPTQEESHE